MNKTEFGYGSMDISQQQISKNSKEINQRPLLKGLDFSEFTKNFSVPVILDRTSIINVSKYKDSKKKKNVLVYTYDIFQNDSLETTEDQMKQLSKLNHSNILPISEVYVKKPKNNMNVHTFYLTTSYTTETNPQTLQDKILTAAKNPKFMTIIVNLTNFLILGFEKMDFWNHKCNLYFT